MKSKNFDDLVERRIDLIRKTLKSKGEEYSMDNKDRLDNFKRAGEFQRCIPEKALLGMAAKHLLSIFNIVDKISDENIKVGLRFIVNPIHVKITRFMIDEKIGDMINYLILLEALIKERYD